MDTYIIHEGKLPREIKADYEPAIFNTLSFSALQDPLHWLSYYLIDQEKKTAAAGIHFHVSDGVASSPFRAPFGSVECSDKIKPASLYRFLEYIQADLKQKGVSEIHIKNPPRAYFPENGALLEMFLLNQNFTVSDSQITAVIPITDAPFAEGIRRSQKLRMRQAEKAKFTFRNVPLAKIEEVYQFISRCHSDKGYKLSISLQDLQKTATAFGDRYLLFGIYDGEKMVAASVSIRVYSHILYNFLINHEKQYNSLSPDRKSVV